MVSTPQRLVWRWPNALGLIVLLALFTPYFPPAQAISAVTHECIYDRLLHRPLAELPVARVSLRTRAGREVSAYRMTEAASDTAEPARRGIRFHIVEILNASCGAAGDVVPDYIAVGNTVECSAEDVLTPEKKAFAVAAVAEATRRLSAALEAIPLQRIEVPANPCGGFDHDGMEVEDADFVLFVSAAPLSQAGQTIAWGRPCVREDGSPTGRPVVGHINFVPPRIGAGGHVEEQTIAITMHEVSHALGFINLFSTLASYVDENGVRQSGGTVAVYRPGLQKEVKLVRTPRVLAAARKHFGCSTLDGVEIEDMGGAGTAGSHWKKRIFYEEALVGVISSASLFYSSVTLAFFEDAGFYKANYYNAQDKYAWGYQRGCDFLMQSCRYLYDNKLATEFCFQESSSTRPLCTFSRDSVGYCGVTNYGSALPAAYQYYPGEPRRGGTLDTMDYCPAVLYYTNVNCVSRYSIPLTNLYGNEFGPSSRCFDSNLITHTLPLLKHSPHCLRSSCNGEQVVLSVQGQPVSCPADGTAGRADTGVLRGLHGYIECPASAELCPFTDTSGVVDVADPQLPKGIETPIFTPATSTASTCTSQLETCTAAEAIAASTPLLCGPAVSRLLRCLQPTCRDAAKGWAQQLLGVHADNCWQRIDHVAALCTDGYVGANVVCNLLQLS